MSGDHEMVVRFREQDLPLCASLEAMLNEDPAHRTDRRGCGFTQATRFLAARINTPRSCVDRQDLDLFAHWAGRNDEQRLQGLLQRAGAVTWRHWDHVEPSRGHADESLQVAQSLVQAEARRQARLRFMPEVMKREESVLLAGMIRDLVLPSGDAGTDPVTLPLWPEKLPVGSCPTAEKCFLELAHGFMPRKARCNQLIDDDGRVVMIEKINMGDDHSCISLVPLRLGGVCLPPGSLLAARYDVDQVPRADTTAPMRGSRIRVSDCDGFRLLRLTTLAVSPEHRARAFSVHFEAQVQAGLFEPDTTELQQLRALDHG
jgi:hypothetical protein